MSIYGVTKGTELEKTIDIFMKAETNGSMLYQALARMAREQGYADAADEFVKIANQEAIHSGYFAVLNGKYPQDFWKLVKGIQKAEAAASQSITPMIEALKAMGLNEAANELSVFMDQETQHGIITERLLKKHAPELLENDADDVSIMSMLTE